MAFTGRLGLHINFLPKLHSVAAAKLGTLCLISMWLIAFRQQLAGWINTYLHSGMDYQGLCVIPAIFILVAQRSTDLKRAAVNCRPGGLILLLAMSLLWLCAKTIDLAMLSNLALIGMLFAIIYCMCATKVIKVLALPLLCLFLLMPIGVPIFSALEKFTAWLLLNLLTPFDSQVYWQGAHIEFNHHIFGLDYLLNSLHHLLSFALGSALFATSYGQRLSRQCLFIGVITAAPIVASVLGSFIIILMSKWVPWAKLSFDVQTYWNWIVTSLAISYALVRAPKHAKHTYTQDIDWQNSFKGGRETWGITTLLGTCLLLMAPFVATSLNQQQHFNKTTTQLSTPNIVRNWNGPQIVPTKDKNTLQVEYRQRAQAVRLGFTKIMQKQPLSLEHGAGFDFYKQATTRVKLNDLDIPVIETIIRANDHFQIIWNVFRVNKHLAVNSLYLKVLINFYTLSNEGADVYLITLSTRAEHNIQEGRSRLHGFMQDVLDTANAPWLAARI